MVIKTKAAAAKAARVAAQAEAMRGVRIGGFNAGVSQGAAIVALNAACGKAPNLVLYTAAKLELRIGFMASALQTAGDNRPMLTLFDHCRDRLTVYQGAGGTAPLKKGMKGRRTAAEEKAAAYATTMSSRLFASAGIKIPDGVSGAAGKGSTKPARGKGDGANKRQDAKAGKVAEKATPADTVRRFAGKDAKANVMAHFGLLAAALKANADRNAKLIPPALATGVADFCALVTKLSAE